MARVGRITVTCDLGEERPYVSSYQIIEIESAGTTFVGITNEESSYSGLAWYCDITADNTADLDGMFNFGGTNTYAWNEPMTEIPDEETGVTLPISISDVTDLQSALNGKAPASHTHTIANITNLQSTLDGKAATNHHHGNAVLWSGGSYMNASQTMSLSKKISEQDHGIVIVFSGYDITNKVALNNSWTTHFVPKEMVQYNNGGGHTFMMAINAAMSEFGAKYLYIYDDKITGHVSNTQTGTGASGITFANNKYVMRYVIGF